jgi:hypothetical protein
MLGIKTIFKCYIVVITRNYERMGTDKSNSKCALQKQAEPIAEVADQITDMTEQETTLLAY